jgi:hypothetical protein
LNSNNLTVSAPLTENSQKNPFLNLSEKENLNQLTKSIKFSEEKDSTSFNNTLTIIYADDESFIRQSAIRCIKKASKDLKINIKVIESQDGIETYYIFYRCILEGIKIDLIFSDEHMVYQKGSRTSKIIKELTEMKNLNNVPFYLVTAFEKDFIKCEQFCLTEIIAKPLNKDAAIKIIGNYLKMNNIS